LGTHSINFIYYHVLKRAAKVGFERGLVVNRNCIFLTLFVIYSEVETLENQNEIRWKDNVQRKAYVLGLELKNELSLKINHLLNSSLPVLGQY
tara:strand:+ start:858 stop:1136 length:279 start_codon:yes stop_codon:yes gene_type:complete